MSKQDSVNATISQYPSELQALLGKVSNSNKEGLEMMCQITSNNACSSNDGYVKDRVGGHAFCINVNSFIKQVWYHTQTVGLKSEMSSLQAKHSGALAILLVLHSL